MSCISSFTWLLFTFKVTRFSARLADADIGESFFVSTTWNCKLVFAWFTSHFTSITLYNIMTDLSYIRSFDLLSWNLGLTSSSSLQTSECKIILHDAPLSIWYSTTCLLIFFLISVGATRRFFFASLFAISSWIMYVYSLLDDSSEYSSWYNWVDAFCFQTFAKLFSFRHFPRLSLHAKQPSGDSCFPFLPQYPQDLFLSPPPLKSRLLWLPFLVWIICPISLWLVSIFPVSPSVTGFFLLIMLLLELSQVLLCYLNVSTHHCCLIYCQWWFS